MAEVLKQEQTSHPEKQIIIRSTLPQHFDNHQLYPPGYYYGSIMNTKCLNESNFKEHFSNFYQQRLCTDFGFKYLNSAPLYAERWDLHYDKVSYFKNHNDCTHWCFTPENIMPEVALIQSDSRIKITPVKSLSPSKKRTTSLFFSCKSTTWWHTFLCGVARSQGLSSGLWHRFICPLLDGRSAFKCVRSSAQNSTSEAGFFFQQCTIKQCNSLTKIVSESGDWRLAWPWLALRKQLKQGRSPA